MNVLSCFDGMSCGQLALERLGIKVDNYYASEIDKHAIKATQNRFPKTIQLGSVTDVKGSDLPPIILLMGGSPCQGFSFAGKGLNFEDPRSKLFFEFVRLLKECKPKYFLLENVRMKKEHEEVISNLLGVNPIRINSALVSAQNRDRLYWTNIGLESSGLFGELTSSIPPPKDKKIVLKDILEESVDEKYFLTETSLSRIKGMTTNERGIRFHKGDESKSGISELGRISNESQKTDALIAAHQPKVLAQRGRPVDNPKSRVPGQPTAQRFEERVDGKTNTNTISTVQKDNLIQVGMLYDNNSDAGRIYSDEGKARTLKGEAGGGGAKMGLYQVGVLNDNGYLKESNEKSNCIDANFHKGMDNHSPLTMVVQRARGKNNGGEHDKKVPTISHNSWEHNNHLSFTDRIRRLTPVECCRLQTVPDDYFKDSGVSETQQYRMLGNGWTIDVITHILSYIR